MSSALDDLRQAPSWASMLIAVQVIASEFDYSVIGVPRLPVIAILLWLPIPLIALRSERFIELLTTRPLRAYALMIAWGFATIAWSAVPISSARTMLSIAGLSMTAIWYVSNYGFTQYSRVLVGGMVVYLTAGFLSDVATVLESGAVYRFDGYNLHPTDLARIALVTALVSAVQLTQRSTSPPSRRAPSPALMWSGFVIGVITLAMTGTRTAMLALGLALFVISWRVLGVGRTMLIGAALAVALAIAFGSVPDPSDFVARDAEGRDITNVSGRVTIWSVAIDLWRAAPVIGHGVSSNELLLPQASFAGELPVMLANHAHNMALEILVGQGVVGAALTIIALVSFAAAGRSPHARLAGVVLLGVLIAGLTEGVFGRPTGVYSVVAALFAQRAIETLADRPRSESPPLEDRAIAGRAQAPTSGSASPARRAP